MTFLIIGGPHDGQEIELPRAQNQLDLPYCIGCDFDRSNPIRQISPIVKPARYRLEVLRGQDESFHFFLHYELSPDDAIKKLFDCYKKGPR